MKIKHIYYIKANKKDKSRNGSVSVYGRKTCPN